MSKRVDLETAAQRIGVDAEQSHAGDLLFGECAVSSSGSGRLTPGMRSYCHRGCLGNAGCALFCSEIQDVVPGQSVVDVQEGNLLL